MHEIGSNRGASYFVNKAPNTAAFVATTIAFATAFARRFDLIIAAGVLVSHVSEHTSAFGRKPPQMRAFAAIQTAPVSRPSENRARMIKAARLLTTPLRTNLFVAILSATDEVFGECDR